MSMLVASVRESVFRTETNGRVCPIALSVILRKHTTAPSVSRGPCKQADKALLHLVCTVYSGAAPFGMPAAADDDESMALGAMKDVPLALIWMEGGGCSAGGFETLNAKAYSVLAMSARFSHSESCSMLLSRAEHPT